jgi:hypothetical protein
MLDFELGGDNDGIGGSGLRWSSAVSATVSKEGGPFPGGGCTKSAAIQRTVKVEKKTSPDL